MERQNIGYGCPGVRLKLRSRRLAHALRDEKVPSTNIARMYRLLESVFDIISCRQSEMDHENHQDLWLPIFFLLTLIYTTLGVAGAWLLWITYRGVRIDAIRWLLLAAFLILPRWIYMATLEHPEPRYVVEFFPFLSVLGGICVQRKVGDVTKVFGK